MSCSNVHLCTLLQVVGWVGAVVDNAQGPQQQRCSPGSFITYWYRTTPSLMPHWWHGAKTSFSLFPSLSLSLSLSLHMYMYIYLYVYVYIYIYIYIRPHQMPFPIFILTLRWYKYSIQQQKSSPEKNIEIGADFRVPP